MEKQTSHNELVIRKMTENDVYIAVKWASLEGWNPGINDAQCFYNTDPEGFFTGELKGEPVACISAVAYDEKFGFLGFYIVKPEYRGQGFGMQIWNAGMTYLGDRNIGLDGVLAQQENYKKSGFKLAYRNIRYTGTAKGKAFKDIISLKEISFNTLLEYDNKMFPVSRPGFLKDWISQPDRIGYGILEENKLAGYGVLRTCHNGYKIGPLFADNAEIAEKLFLSLSKEVEGQQIFLDIPEINSSALELVSSYNMEKVFETARMYTKAAPNIETDKIFGVTTFELG